MASFRPWRAETPAEVKRRKFRKNVKLLADKKLCGGSARRRQPIRAARLVSSLETDVASMSNKTKTLQACIQVPVDRQEPLTDVATTGSPEGVHSRYRGSESRNKKKGNRRILSDSDSPTERPLTPAASVHTVDSSTDPSPSSSVSWRLSPTRMLRKKYNIIQDSELETSIVVPSSSVMSNNTRGLRDFIAPQPRIGASSLDLTAAGTDEHADNVDELDEDTIILDLSPLRTTRNDTKGTKKRKRARTHDQEHSPRIDLASLEDRIKQQSEQLEQSMRRITELESNKHSLTRQIADLKRKEAVSWQWKTAFATFSKKLEDMEEMFQGLNRSESLTKNHTDPQPKPPEVPRYTNMSGQSTSAVGNGDSGRRRPWPQRPNHHFQGSGGWQQRHQNHHHNGGNTFRQFQFNNDPSKRGEYPPQRQQQQQQHQHQHQRRQQQIPQRHGPPPTPRNFFLSSPLSSSPCPRDQSLSSAAQISQLQGSTAKGTRRDQRFMSAPARP